MIYEIGAAGDTHFIATEYIEGQTLRQRVKAVSITILEALDITIQVASALAAAHKACIIHRDIKPENIMLRDDGYLKVLDFGLAKLTEARDVNENSEASTMAQQTDPGTVMGTVSYMSPEQVRGLAVDMRTDIFSLGVVLYQSSAEDLGQSFILAEVFCRRLMNAALGYM